MALSRDDQRRIIEADAARRQARLAREVSELLAARETSPATHARDYSYVNPELVRGAGVVCPPVDVRVTERWRPTATRAVGIAPGTNPSEPTVLVTLADGTSSVRTVASFRRSRSTRTRNTVTAVAEHRTTAADLPAIGDSNH